MSNLTAVIGLHPQGEGEERFRFECAGGAVAVTAATDRLTPYGGAAAWSHYLEQLGVVADLARRFPLERSSPNATPVGDVVQAFMFNCLMGDTTLRPRPTRARRSSLGGDLGYEKGPPVR
jgi:hypothetical protein